MVCLFRHFFAYIVHPYVVELFLLVIVLDVKKSFTSYVCVVLLGDVVISGDVTLTVDGDLNRRNPQFTLTCISTGGPATTVTWTRDSVTVTEGTETVLDDPVTAQYTHTLTGSTAGVYTCTVANSKPSSDSASITVEGI